MPFPLGLSGVCLCFVVWTRCAPFILDIFLRGLQPPTPPPTAPAGEGIFGCKHTPLGRRFFNGPVADRLMIDVKSTRVVCMSHSVWGPVVVGVI